MVILMGKCSIEAKYGLIGLKGLIVVAATCDFGCDNSSLLQLEIVDTQKGVNNTQHCTQRCKHNVTTPQSIHYTLHQKGHFLSSP